jgi:hypothetical protein
MWNRSEDLDKTLDDTVDRASIVSGDSSENNAKEKTQRNTHEPDGQRYSCTMDNAAQHVTAESVGSQQVYIATFPGSEKMPFCLEQSPELISGATREKANRISDGLILYGSSLPCFGVKNLLCLVDKRTQMEITFCIQEMDPLRWCHNVARISIKWIVWRDKARK